VFYDEPGLSVSMKIMIVGSACSIPQLLEEPCTADFFAFSLMGMLTAGLVRRMHCYS
jgi:hypothetical protein